MSRSMRGFPGFSGPSDSGKGRSPPLQGQVRDGGRLSLSKGNRSEDFSTLRLELGHLMSGRSLSDRWKGRPFSSVSPIFLTAEDWPGLQRDYVGDRTEKN